MLPIRDKNPSGQTPYVTWGLIGMNILVFLAYWPAGTEASVLTVFHDWGLVPARLRAGQGLYTPLSAMFIHGGWLHLGLNMLFLRIFGDNLESEMGGLRYLLFYLACGLVAMLMQFLAGMQATTPIAGASGAVAGVMGGYLLMFPRARVDLLVYLVVALRVVAVPAWLLLSLWFAAQVFGGVSPHAAASGVAYWAHIGGFLTGIALTARLWRMRGGRMFWRRFHGLPPHPEARFSVPVVRRRGAILPPPQAHGLFRSNDGS